MLLFSHQMNSAPAAMPKPVSPAPSGSVLLKDRPVSEYQQRQFRKDWGTKNNISAPGMVGHEELPNAVIQHKIHVRIANFVATAIYPQQLTVPRQYATTREGCWVYKILKGRVISGYQEDGVRVVVQENAKQARFVISPIFGSEHDALSWAHTHMGATI